SSAERIPQRVDFLSMYGARRVEDLTLKLRARWSRSIPDGILPFPALLGAESLTASTEIWLDETHHGPHGMLAGTTGAGKSELLQTLICSLVIEHDPRLLNLLLIDFKGGSTFNVFANLPHTVGMVTNLDGTLVARTLAALKAETDWRQAFLKSMRVRDITQYHRIYSQDINTQHFGSVNYKPLPHLFIIVDEFAQLAKEMPDFLRELVRTAQVGRSLGLHLILGTQSPMDVITEEMNANLQFRICLRVQNIEASRAMLRRPDAAYLPASYPGRGYFQVGEQGMFKQFQTAYVGAEYHRQDALIAERAVSEAPILEFLGTTGDKQDLLPRPARSNSHTYTVAQAVADLVVGYAEQERIPASKPILLRPLSERMTLADTFEHIGVGGWNGERWLSPGRDHLGRPIPLGSAPVGMVDDAANRTQYPLWLHLGSDDGTSVVRRKDGHILIVGTPGTGKTNLLRTLALSAALLHAPDKLHLYFLSFTGAGLDDLGHLPHAERVIYGAESERIRRLFARLIRILEERQAGEASRVPLITVFIDQYEGFREMARTHDHLTSEFERLLVEGRAAGIAFVITASSVDSVPDRLRSIIGQRIAFTLGDTPSYAMLVGRLSAPPENSPPPGRGYIYNSPPLLCQIALPQMSARDGLTSEAEMLNRMSSLIQEMRAGYENAKASLNVSQSPQPVHILPSRIDLKQLLDDVPMVSGDQRILTLLGRWDDDALTPFLFDWTATGGQMIVTGPPGSGKTNLLHAAAISAAASSSPDQLSLLLIDCDGRSSAPLSALKHTVAYASDPPEVDQYLRMMQEDLSAGSGRKFVVMIDDYDSFAETLRQFPELDTLNLLRDLLRSYGGERLFLWIAAYLDRSTDVLIKYLLMRRAGFALVVKDSLTRLNVRTTGLSGEMMPTGRAYLPSERGSSIGIVQTALVSDAAGMIQAINERWQGYQAAPQSVEPVKTTRRQAPSTQNGQNSTDSLDDPIAEIDVEGLIEDLLGVGGSQPPARKRS
ncbi:MAG TPA: FtsK/SpoIIIE domain-containing protein, partial [Phototrophicaceae bacterium]|nr:FtsK/SpoIIIE domain-containing protein [Phototrophicaceae bacterium]